MITATPIHIKPDPKKALASSIYVFAIAAACIIPAVMIPVLFILVAVLIGTGFLILALHKRNGGIAVTAEGVKLYSSTTKFKFAPFAQIYRVTLVQRYWSGIGQAQPIPHTAVVFSDATGHEIFYVWSGHYSKADLDRLYASFDPADRAELKEADMLTTFETAV